MNVKTIASTKWLVGDNGEPLRYVVLAHFKENGEIKKFSHHMEVIKPGKNKPEKYYGYYYQCPEDAMKDMEIMKKHQKIDIMPNGQCYFSGGVNTTPSSRRPVNKIPVKKVVKRVEKKRCK